MTTTTAKSTMTKMIVVTMEIKSRIHSEGEDRVNQPMENTAKVARNSEVEIAKSVSMTIKTQILELIKGEGAEVVIDQIVNLEAHQEIGADMEEEVEARPEANKAGKIMIAGETVDLKAQKVEMTTLTPISILMKSIERESQ